MFTRIKFYDSFCRAVAVWLHRNVIAFYTLLRYLSCKITSSRRPLSLEYLRNIQGGLQEGGYRNRSIVRYVI